jgi:regulatory protein
MDTKKTVFQVALNLLARKRYSEAELKKKLFSKKIGAPEEVEKAVIRLKEIRYLDDLDFAQLFIGDALRRKPQGVKLLRKGLVKRGIPKTTIVQAFQKKSIDELEFAQLALKKKQKLLSTIPLPEQKEKLYRFLVSRGFGDEVIFKTLRKM